jgi:hypothetical protein
MRRILVAVAGVAAATLACHTITEDLPARPTQIGTTVGVPVVVISVPVPSPTPAPTPTPAPAASPTPRSNPTAPPDPNPEPDPGGQNRNPVVRVACSVYFVECDGQVVPGSHGTNSAQVGCRVHLDATTKDANNEHTYRTEPQWVFSNPGMIERSGNSAWNPAITARGAHTQSMYAQADGARCDSFSITFH